MPARIRAGDNLADDIQGERETPTLREFVDEYLRRSDPHRKLSGRKTVRIYLKARILLAFARKLLDRIGPEDVAAWFDAASWDKSGAANRALEILRAMMFWAEEWGLRERGFNPCLGIAKNPRNHVARFLDADGLARLGALDAREADWPEAVAAIGLPPERSRRRRGQAPRFKDWPRALPLDEAARTLIEALPDARDPEAFLFPGLAEGRGACSLVKCWRGPHHAAAHRAAQSVAMRSVRDRLRTPRRNRDLAVEPVLQLRPSSLAISPNHYRA